MVCSRVRELLETPAATIALEISSPNARVAALQKRWGRLRASLDLILNQEGADMADLPGGPSGLLVRDHKGKRADWLVIRIDPGVVSLVAELRGHERQAAEEVGQWKTTSRSASPSALAFGGQARPAAGRRGVGLVGEEGWSWRTRDGRTTRWIKCRKNSTGCAPWRACPSIPRQCRARRRATAVGWRERLESDLRRGKRRRRWATEPQQIPSAGTWIWSSINGGRTWLICPAAPAGCWCATTGQGS